MFFLVRFTCLKTPFHEFKVYDCKIEIEYVYQSSQLLIQLNPLSIYCIDVQSYD